ncbi:hypothetical protein AB6A40_007554 [Gnathostoma spinigerum]|uniref:Uncharacterized protein n=1 Tax=Gnathostoma spinigerum TaxID=75299 RepID=A0ABD6EMT0_9BILA
MHHKAKEIFNSAKLNLWDFSTNNPLPREITSSPDCHEATVMKMFGLIWDTAADKLELERQQLSMTSISINVLVCFIAQHFDPHSTVCSHSLPYKCLLKDITKQSPAGDDLMPTDSQKQWNGTKLIW